MFHIANDDAASFVIHRRSDPGDPGRPQDAQLVAGDRVAEWNLVHLDVLLLNALAVSVRLSPHLTYLVSPILIDLGLPSLLRLLSRLRLLPRLPHLHLYSLPRP